MYCMEGPKLKWVKICWLFGIHLALFADVGFCKSSSGTSEKYLSKSYFEKYDSLFDSSFAGYTANELLIGLCGTSRNNLDGKLSVHKRHLIGEGAHRKLHYTIKIHIQPDLVAEKFSHLWKFVLVEKLPSGIFADPFELQHLISRGVLADATVSGDTNLEFPTVSSNRSIVEVHVNISRDMLFTNDNGMKIEIKLPLHTRYPPLEERGFSRVEFGNPDLFILCNIEEISATRSCLLARELDAKAQTVVWEVPYGVKEHSEMVSVVTFASSVVSALFIVFTTLYYPVSGNRR